ncbi:MAG: CPBP family intramembrane metalloprotease [Ruminococcus sp.]|jgi:membrane protease YdiL (CAAX protease family)|nr:CPBP family intramembrane metalloprotease [Ruminococcus sp.]
MVDDITPEYYRAEIASLHQEVSELKKLNQQQITLDPMNPFGNKTQYTDFSGDYSEIVPQVKTPGCIIPVEPNTAEKHSVRHFYNIAGLMVILHEVAVNAFMIIFMLIASGVLQFRNIGIDAVSLSNYQSNSSISMGINLIGFLICNVGFALLGLRMAKIKPLTIIKTRDFNFARCFQYCLIAIFLQMIAGCTSFGISDIIEKYGYTVYSVDDAFQNNIITGKLITFIYTCIVAPITEEIFFRGMMLKLLSKANQRFAVFATAFLFGLGHGNISQFALGFIVGIFFAHITLKHNSIVPSIIAHMFLNTFSTVLSEFCTQKSSLISASLGFVYNIVAILGFILLIEFRLANKLPSTTPEQSRRGIAIAKTSVPFVFAVVIYVGIVAYNILFVSK